MTDNPKDSNAFAHVGLICGRFRDMDPDATIAAVAGADGGTSRLTYGDLRTLLSLAFDAGDRLQRIAVWHSRESGPGGLVGDYCTECGIRWPCDTRRMADGTYVDEAGPGSTSPEPGRATGGAIGCWPPLLGDERNLPWPGFNPAHRVVRCGQSSAHGPHFMDHGPDQPRNCPGTGRAAWDRWLRWAEETQEASLPPPALVSGEPHDPGAYCEVCRGYRDDPHDCPAGHSTEDGAASPEPRPEPLAEAPTLTEIVEFLDPDGKHRGSE